MTLDVGNRVSLGRSMLSSRDVKGRSLPVSEMPFDAEIHTLTPIHYTCEIPDKKLLNDLASQVALKNISVPRAQPISERALIQGNV
eukprot:scaffold168428_cov33-Tisochrysis_lutea.AAC.2